MAPFNDLQKCGDALSETYKITPVKFGDNPLACKKNHFVGKK